MLPDQKNTALALIVDDDPVIRQLARAALERSGWSVEEAENGSDALGVFQRLPPDVVLLDVMMPGMDGFATCAALRTLPEAAHVPVLIMTGLDDHDSITRAYDAGATDFLTKPLNGLLLAHRVRYIVRSNRVMQELRASRASLAEARDAALEGTRLKSEFLATVSHEIRTPMNGILGMTECLLDTPLTTEQRDYADTIHKSGEELLLIVNDILDFSNFDSGKLQLEKADVELSQLVNGVVGLFQDRARSKGVTLSSLMPMQMPAGLRGDAVRLRQILSNLIGNAVKFTERGEIVVRVEEEEKPAKQDSISSGVPPTVTRVTESTGHFVNLRVSVTDTGIGIAPEACARIFQPFTQADGSHTRKYGGTGLGLAICQQLVELMGGIIGVDSAPGRGSIFQFTVPLECTTRIGRTPQHQDFGAAMKSTRPHSQQEAA